MTSKVIFIIWQGVLVQMFQSEKEGFYFLCTFITDRERNEINIIEILCVIFAVSDDKKKLYGVRNYR